MWCLFWDNDRGESDIYEGQLRNYLEYGPAAVRRFTAPEVYTSCDNWLCLFRIENYRARIQHFPLDAQRGFDVVNWGYKMVKQEIDVAIVASSDAPVFPFAWSTFCALEFFRKRNEEPEKASRPYDRNRDGMVLSEGGAAIVIEELNHALDRGANIYAEVVSYATSCEAQDVYRTDVSGQSLVFAFEQAMIAGKMRKEEIDYICAHGNAIPSYDVAETNAFKTFFGDYAYKKFQ